ncbi:MAG: glycosyltransferase family 87 protein [Pseudomonadota bacterium]
MSATHVGQLSEQGKYDRTNIAAFVCFALALLSLTGFIGNYAETLSDFSAFYNAGKMAGALGASDAYDLRQFRLAYADTFPGAPSGYGWFYPPTFLLVQQPLSELPYQWARGVWLTSTFCLYLFAMRPLARNWLHWLLIASAPAIAFHWHSGQTGFLVAGLLAFALFGLARKNVKGDWQAGVAIGLLTLKPHLWLLLPVFLLIEGRWRVVLVAVLTTAALIAVSFLFYGFAPWQAMITSVVSGYTDNHADQIQLFAKMGNVSGFLSFVGLETINSLAQLASVVLLCALMYWLKKARASLPVRLAFAVAACFLIAPHNMIYDHTIFVPICALILMDSKPKEHTLLIGSAALLLAWPALFALVPGLDTIPLSFVIVLLFTIALAFNGLRLNRPIKVAEAG